MSTLDQIGIIFELVFTILIYTFIVKENVFYRFAEHVFVGVSTGFTVILALKSIYNVAYINIVDNQRYSLFIAVILGLMLYLRYNPKTEVLYRWPIALLIGVGASLAMTAGIDAYFLKQIRATIVPLNTFNNVVLVFATVFALFYFFFTIPREDVVSKTTGKLGRYIIMTGLGASYAGIIASRITLVINRMTFIYTTLFGG